MASFAVLCGSACTLQETCCVPPFVEVILMMPSYNDVMQTSLQIQPMRIKIIGGVALTTNQ